MKFLWTFAALLTATTLADAQVIPTGTTVILNNSTVVPAGEKVTVPANTYVGYTENFASNFTQFLQQIQAVSDPSAIIGIDSVTPTVNRNVPDTINLSTLNGAPEENSYYIGTASRITLTGPIIPTLPPGAENRAPLYLAALDNAYLNVATPLGNTASPVNSVVIGRPAGGPVSTAGTVELSGANTYTGPTSVLGGTLRVNSGNNLGAGLLSVAPNAQLSLGTSGTVSNILSLAPGSSITGNGTFTSLVTVGPGVNLIPGGIGSIDEIHFHGGLVLMPGAIWHIDISANDSDKLCVWDTLLLPGAFPANPIYINLYSIGATGAKGPLSGFDPTQPHNWTITERSAAIIGFNPASFNINADAFFLQNPNLASLGSFTIDQVGQTLALNFTPVPEPATYALMGLGLALLALANHRRRQRR